MAVVLPNPSSLSSTITLTQARIFVWTLVATSILFPDFFQPLLTLLWDGLYNSSFYRLSTFETILTVTSYAVIEPWYTYVFARRPELRIDVQHAAASGQRKRGGEGDQKAANKGAKPKLPKMKRPSKRLGEIFVYIAPLLLMDLTMIKKFAGVPLNDIRVSGGYAPLPTLDGGTHVATTSNSTVTTTAMADQGSIHSTFLLPTLHNFTAVSPLQLTRALPPTAPTSRRLALELLSSFLLYDTLFFALHFALHTIPVVSRAHLRHHTHGEMHPQITNALSIPERLSLVLLANFSLNILGAHVLTRTVFVPVFVELLVQVHSGMELPWAYERFLPPGWALGAREHARHHRTGGGALAPFFGLGDSVLRRGKAWVRSRR